jgi:integrase
VPYFPMLSEDNVSEGFLRDEDYGKLADGAAKVGLWLRALLAVYYNFGWRKAEAAEHLKVSQIDLAGRTILLSRRSTKNKEPKRARMSHEVFELLSACIVGKGPEDSAITHDDGSPVGDFRKVWRSLCISVGLGRMLCRACGKGMSRHECECGSTALRYDGLLVHDLRCTSVRNLRRLGFNEKTIMEISGHKTAHVFRRHDIVDESDLAAVADALDYKQAGTATDDLAQLRHDPGSQAVASTRDAAEDATIQ